MIDLFGCVARCTDSGESLIYSVKEGIATPCDNIIGEPSDTLVVIWFDGTLPDKVIVLPHNCLWVDGFFWDKIEGVLRLRSTLVSVKVVKNYY